MRVINSFTGVAYSTGRICVKSASTEAANTEITSTEGIYTGSFCTEAASIGSIENTFIRSAGVKSAD